MKSIRKILKKADTYGSRTNRIIVSDDLLNKAIKELKQGQENYNKLWDLYSELKRENRVLQEYINETKDCMYCKEAKAIKVWDERNNK